jgi:hypothetical protein
MIGQKTILSGKVEAPVVATSFMTAVKNASSLARTAEKKD